jgi:thiamine biosynthesis lipoprotein
MSSPAELIIFCDDKTRSDKVAKAVLQDAKRLEKKYNYYDENSILSKINQRVDERLDHETKFLLLEAKKYYQATKGVFDITIATIKDLYSSQKSIKSLEKLKNDLLPFVGCEHFVIKKDKIIFDNEFTKLDLGGFVKEYAVDRASMIIKKKRIKSALVNFGGDIYAIGKKPNGEKFKIGIKDPNDKTRHKTFVQLQDQALTTSASYERNYQIEDKNFSHIISKDTTQKTQKSVSVISNSCLTSGVYSTSLMIDPNIKTEYRVIQL